MTSGVNVPPSDGFPKMVPLLIIGKELWPAPKRETVAGKVAGGKSGDETEGIPNRVDVAFPAKGLKFEASGCAEGELHCPENPEEAAAAWAED